MTALSRDEEIQGAIAWCYEQAESIMGISAGCASTHGDPSGGLQMINSMASDIAINLEMMAERYAIAAGTGTAKTRNGAEGEACQSGPSGIAQKDHP